MKFYESAWFISYDLTGKEPGEVRLLVRDSIPFPFLEKDEYGYVICLPNVKKLKDGMLEYEGMIFDPKDEGQIQFLWNLFKSSVYYLSLFTLISNADVYSDHLKGKKENTALTAILMVEDAVLTAYHLISIIFERTTSTKILANHAGKMWIKINFQSP